MNTPPLVRLLLLLMLLMFAGCGGGGTSSPATPALPAVPYVLEFQLHPNAGLIEMKHGRATMHVTLPAPANMYQLPDRILIGWNDGLPATVIPVRDIDNWPHPVPRTYSVPGPHRITVEYRYGEVILGRGEGLLHVSTGGGVPLCGTVTPTPVAGVIFGREPLTVRLDPACGQTPEPWHRDGVRFDVYPGTGISHPDLTPAEVAALSLVYPAGTYALLLWARDPESQHIAATWTVEVIGNAAPELVLHTVPARNGNDVTLAQKSGPSSIELDLRQSRDPDGDLTVNGLLSVDWGDGSPGYESVPFSNHQLLPHAYEDPGMYLIDITLSDGAAQVSQQLRAVKPQVVAPVLCGVWDPPPDENNRIVGTLPFSPKLDMSCSSDEDSNLLLTGRITVEFGDGPVLNNEPFGTYANALQKPYTAAGEYTMTVTLTDVHGLTDSQSWTIVVLAPPANQQPVAVAQAVPISGSVPLPVQFSSSASFDPDGSITSTIWNFGDPGVTGGGVSIHPNPLYFYQIAGEHTATLLVVDDSGLGNPLDRDSDTVQITVTP